MGPKSSISVGSSSSGARLIKSIVGGDDRRFRVLILPYQRQHAEIALNRVIHRIAHDRG